MPVNETDAEFEAVAVPSRTVLAPDEPRSTYAVVATFVLLSPAVCVVAAEPFGNVTPPELSDALDTVPFAGVPIDSVVPLTHCTLFVPVGGAVLNVSVVPETV